jgi:hypothetical protein
MSDTVPPVGGGRSAAPVGSWMQMPAIQLIAVATATVALMSFVSSQVSKTDEKLGKTEDKLTALINQQTKLLAADIKESGNRSYNDVSEARQRFFDAVTKLTDTHEKLGKTASEVEKTASNVGLVRKDLDSTTEKIPALTSSLRATESKLADTDSKLNTTINSFNGKLSSITDKIQTAKSHEDRYIESFGVTPGRFHSGTFNGRIVAFPLTSDKEAAKELEDKRFTKTRARLGGTEIRAFIPPSPPRRGVNDLPAVLDQSILTISIASRSSQTGSQPSSLPTENQPSPEPAGSR